MTHIIIVDTDTMGRQAAPYDTLEEFCKDQAIPIEECELVVEADLPDLFADVILELIPEYIT